MSHYIRFEDESEYSICGNDEEFAIEIAKDSQRKEGKSEVVIEVKEVPE